MRFATLGSGSRGNALLVEFGSTLLMVDCGLPWHEVEERLADVGRSPRDVTALLVSHEHADHVRSVAPFVRRYGVETWMTAGTASVLRDVPRIQRVSCQRPLDIGGIRVEPYTVPHDAREPCQFVFCAGGRRLGMLTDAGCVTPHIRERLAGCDALAVEFNHDVDTLVNGSYPPAVKARVASRFGHLSNMQAADLVAGFRGTGLQWVAALHISERNNTPSHVRATFEGVLGSAGFGLHLAVQDAASAWIPVE